MPTPLLLASEQSREISSTVARVSKALSAAERLDILVDTLEAYPLNDEDRKLMEAYAKPVLDVVFRQTSNASLESRVGNAVKAVWQAIVDLFTYLIDRMGEYVSHLMRATEGIYRRAYNAQLGIRAYGGDIPADVYAKGTEKMISGGLRFTMHRLGRIEGDKFIFDNKCLKVLDESISCLNRLVKEDRELAQGFISAINDTESKAAGWYEVAGHNLWNKRATEPVKLPNTSIIGGKAIFILPDGKLSLRPELGHTSFTFLPDYVKNVRVFTKADNLIRLCQLVMDGSGAVRLYNNEVDTRLSLARQAKKITQALAAKNETSEKRRIASAFVKVMFRRSELVSLSLIRALDTAQKIVVSFLK